MTRQCSYQVALQATHRRQHSAHMSHDQTVRQRSAPMSHDQTVFLSSCPARYTQNTTHYTTVTSTNILHRYRQHQILHIYSVSKNVPPYCDNNFINLNRSLKLFHCWKVHKICYKTMLPTTPKICCHTTLRNCGIKITSLQTSLHHHIPAVFVNVVFSDKDKILIKKIVSVERIQSNRVNE